MNPTQPPLRGARGTQDVIAEFRDCLAAKEQFCDRLETIADLLPDGADAHDCLIVAQNIVPMVRRTHAFEEEVVFPLLQGAAARPPGLDDWLERLQFEHLGDEEFANDLCLALRDFVTRRKAANVESLSWMLRGFFNGLRRHIAFERSNLLPVLEGMAH